MTELTNCTNTYTSFWSLRHVLSSISKLYLKFGDIDNFVQRLMKELLQNFEDAANQLFQGVLHY